MASCVFVIQRDGLSWKLKVRPKIEDDEEEERILGRLEDFRRAMEFFCGASQVFCDKHPETFYSPTVEHINEILMLDIIPIDFYECIANDIFFCDDMVEEESTIFV